MRRHLLYVDYSRGASHRRYIVKYVNVSMICTLLSIHHSCLCRQAYRTLEHHHFSRRDFTLFYSFCSHTNWCFIERKINNNNNISFSMSEGKSQLFAFSLRVPHSRAIHRLILILILVMSRSTQGVFLFSCFTIITMCVK
jgi:hypothetical protein